MANGGDLPARVQALENWRIGVDSGIAWLRGLLGGASIILLVGFVWNYVELVVTVRYQKAALDDLKGALEKAAQKEVTKEAEAKIERRVERLEDRMFKPVAALVHQGTIVSIKGSLIVVEEDGQKKSYTLTKDVEVLIDGKAATVEQIKVGAAASFITGLPEPLEISRIEIISTKPKQ